MTCTLQWQKHLPTKRRTSLVRSQGQGWGGMSDRVTGHRCTLYQGARKCIYQHKRHLMQYFSKLRHNWTSAVLSVLDLWGRKQEKLMEVWEFRFHLLSKFSEFSASEMDLPYISLDFRYVRKECSMVT